MNIARTYILDFCHILKVKCPYNKKRERKYRSETHGVVHLMWRWSKIIIWQLKQDNLSFCDRCHFVVFMVCFRKNMTDGLTFFLWNWLKNNTQLVNYIINGLDKNVVFLTLSEKHSRFSALFHYYYDMVVDECVVSWNRLVAYCRLSGYSIRNTWRAPK